MKLLFDQNTSPRLVRRLGDLFPDSNHVFFSGLDSADDLAVWSFARIQGYTVVTKDADFNDLTFLYGSPPKVIWLRLGNCTTAQVEACLRENAEVIHAFFLDPTTNLLELY